MEIRKRNGFVPCYTNNKIIVALRELAFFTYFLFKNFGNLGAYPSMKSIFL